jgi:hypothetical protein
MIFPVYINKDLNLIAHPAILRNIPCRQEDIP